MRVGRSRNGAVWASEAESAHAGAIVAQPITSAAHEANFRLARGARVAGLALAHAWRRGARRAGSGGRGAAASSRGVAGLDTAPVA